MADALELRSWFARSCRVVGLIVASLPAALQAQEPEDLADIVPLIEFVQNRETLLFQEFSPSPFISGSIKDACVAHGETANIMRFDVVVRNTGAGPFVIGDTPPALCRFIPRTGQCLNLNDPNPCNRGGAVDGVFIWSGAHCHWHLQDFNTYRLVRPDGSDAGVGQKQAFAILDWEPWSSSPPPGFFDESHQGISVGWQDRYWGRHNYQSPHGLIPFALPCQFLKTNGLADGGYRMLATVNAAQQFAEGRLDNNSVALPLQVSGNSVVTAEGAPQPPQRLASAGTAGGPPAFVASEPHVTAIFYQIGNAIAARGRVFAAWQDEQVLEVPGGAVSPPAAISIGNGTVDVVVRCGGGSLCRIRGTGRPPYTFSAWEVVPTPLAAQGMPALASSSPGQLDIFFQTTQAFDPSARGLARVAWRGGWTTTHDFGLPPGTTVASSPAAIARAGRTLDAFVRGADNQLWHVYHVPGQGFSTWDGPRGEQVGSQPTVASWGTGRLDIFWRTPSGELGHQWWQAGAGWGGGDIRPHPGVALVGAPSAVSWGPDRVDVFARGANDHLYHLHWDIRWGWGGWDELWNDGDVASPPAALGWAANRLDVAFTTTAGGIGANLWW